MKIIVNADDLGWSTEVNNAVFALMDKRLISSATVMANAPAVVDAVASVVDFPACSFGVHLNLTDFAALSTPAIFYDMQLIDAKGVFTRNIRNITPSREIIRAISKELLLQINTLRDMGVKISHIDSHHNIHTLPWLFPSLREVQQKTGIDKIRISYNCCYPQNYPHQLLKGMAKSLWNWSLRSIAQAKTTDYFTEFEDFMNDARLHRGPRTGTIELMCHPGSYYVSGEKDILESDWQALLDFPFELISYNDL